MTRGRTLALFVLRGWCAKRETAAEAGGQSGVRRNSPEGVRWTGRARQEHWTTKRYKRPACGKLCGDTTSIHLHREHEDPSCGDEPRAPHSVKRKRHAFYFNLLGCRDTSPSPDQILSKPLFHSRHLEIAQALTTARLYSRVPGRAPMTLHAPTWN